MYLYDLRCFTAPTAVIDAHNGPVSKILFRPGATRENVTSLLATLSKTSSLTSVNSSKGSLVMKENVEPLRSRNSSFGSQIFSPIRDQLGCVTPVQQQQLFNVPSRDSRLSTDSVFSPLRDLSGATTSNHISNDSLFSPLRENLDSNNLSPLTNSFPAKKFSVTPLLSSISEEASLANKSEKEKSSIG